MSVEDLLPAALSAARLYRRADLSGLDFDTTDDLEPLEGLVGQSRALDAIHLGTQVDKKSGFNLVVIGPRRARMQPAVKELLAGSAGDRRGQSSPSDWVYVNNFEDSDRPVAIDLPARRARQFQHVMDKLIDDLQSALPAVFQSEDYQTRKGTIDDAFQKMQGEAFAELRNVAAEEIIELPGRLKGIASSISDDRVGLILLGDTGKLSVGAPARRTGQVVDVPVGDAFLGRIVDALGRPLDGQPPPRARGRKPMERPAPAIMDRAPVATPLQTGIKSVDAAIPIGRGQRELILGDRQTGKTTIGLEAILNQRDTGVVSIYCAIGQRASAVARVVDTLRRHDALKRTIVLVASGEDAPGLQFIAPYAATTIAEHFMHRGQDALIVYDDLTRHARAYRELSLLLRRPPGREAFPGDIFFIHARLLERATRLSDEQGGGSLTALPIIETQAQNVSAYIPTNLISITDGQIYVSPELFRAGMIPAVDIGNSVSRVGGDAQLPAYRAIVGDLKLAYAQFEELEAFSRFGSRLDEDTRKQLERGRRVREVLKQDEHDLVPVIEQIAVLFAATTGLLDGVDLEEIARAEKVIRRRVRAELGHVAQRIAGGARIDDDARDALTRSIRAALSSDGLL